MTKEDLHMDETLHAMDVGKRLVQLMPGQVLLNSNEGVDDVLPMQRDPLKVYSVKLFLQSGRLWDSS